MSDRASRPWITSYRAAVVHPVAGPPIADGAVLVEGERIVWVGPQREHPPAPSATITDLGRAILMPGLVNAHTHLDLTVLRGLLDGLPFFEWIRGVVALRDRLSAEETLDSARLGAIEALEAGVTTVGDTAPTGASFEAMREYGLRGVAYLEVFGPDPQQAGPAMDTLRPGIAALQARATPLLTVGVSPHAPYSVSDALYQAAAAHARSAGLRIATHVAESAAESALVVRGDGPFAAFLAGRGLAVAPRGRSPVSLLDRLGVLGRDTLLIHCAACDDADVRAIAAADAAVAVCPYSNRYFGHATAPMGALSRAGVRVGIGSDSMASNDAVDLLREACAAHGAEAGVNSAVIERVTVHGARALGLAAVTGSLEAGKQADFVAFPLPPGAARPAYPPIGARASFVVIGGVVRLRDGLVHGSPDVVRERNRAVARRLGEWRESRTGA